MKEKDYRTLIKGLSEEEIERRLKNLKTPQLKKDCLKELLERERLLKPEIRKAIYSTLKELADETCSYNESNQATIGLADAQLDMAESTREPDLAKDYRAEAAKNYQQIPKNFNKQYIDSDKLKRLEANLLRQNYLEKQELRISPLEKIGLASLITLGLSVFLFSANLTGFAIANLQLRTTNIFGGILFIIGIIGGFFWINAKNRKK